MAKDYWAIKDSWFAIEHNQLFCLLGPNGAGKVSQSQAGSPCIEAHVHMTTYTDVKSTP